MALPRCWPVRNPNDQLEALVTELEELAPERPRQLGPDHLGFAVPLRLSSSEGELQLLTTLTHFGTAVDVTVAELRLEAFLPADQATPRSSPTWDGRHRGEAELRVEWVALIATRRRFNEAGPVRTSTTSTRAPRPFGPVASCQRHIAKSAEALKEGRPREQAGRRRVRLPPTGDPKVVVSRTPFDPG